VKPAAALLVVLATWPAGAGPVLQGARQTPDGACYPDHADPTLWYLAPPPPVLTAPSGRSTVELTLFGYHGSSTTADETAFAAGGVLQFRLRFPHDPGRLTRAARALGGAVRVVPITLSRVDALVVFPGTAARPATETGGSDEGEGGAWEERAFSIRLTPADQALLRRAWEAGSTTLSVDIAAYAVLRVPEGDGNGRTRPGEVPVLADAVPVVLSAASPAVRWLDLEAAIAADYAGLEVGCAEIEAAGGASDTAAIVVRIRARAVNGDTLEKIVTFRKGSPPVQTVRFDSAVRLDDGYDVWTGRRSTTGELESLSSERIPVWQGFLDVCARKAGTEDRLDPRMLY